VDRSVQRQREELSLLDLLPVAALGALWFLLFRPAVLGRATFYLRDLFFYFEPLLTEAGRQIRAGQFPAWNPASGCGAPLAADPNAGVFFPDSLLVAALGADPSAVRWILLLRLLALPLLAGAALRWAGLSCLASFAGGAALLLSGPTASSLPSFPSHLGATILLLPTAVAAWQLRDGRMLPLLVCALGPALAFAAGSPDVALLAAGSVLFFGLRARGEGEGIGEPPGRSLLRATKRIALASLLVAAFAAPLLLPAARLYRRTPRGSGESIGVSKDFLSTRPIRFVEMIWPGIAGDPTSPDPAGWWGKDLHDPGVPCWSSIAFGLVPLLLAPIAFGSPLGRRFGWGAALISLLSLGRFLPGYSLLTQLPILGAQRYPEKWLAGLAPMLAGLFAVALDRMLRYEDEGRRPARGLALLLAALSTLLALSASFASGFLLGTLRILGIVAADFPSRLEGVVATALFREGLSAAAVALAVFLVLAPSWPGWLHRLRWPAVVGILLVALFLAERLPRALSGVRLLDSAVASNPDRSVRAALSVAGTGRFFFDREATNDYDLLRPLSGSRFGLRYAGNSDIDYFSDARARRFVEALQERSFADPAKGGLLALAGVTALSTDDPAARSAAALVDAGELDRGRRLYRLPEGRPARLLHRVAPTTDARDALRRMLAEGAPLDTVAFVETDVPGLAESTGPEDVAVRFPRAGRFEGEIDAGAPGILMIATTWDPGWRVTLDGSTAPAIPVDGMFVGVPVPAGRHRVEGRYVEPAFAIGGGIALLALLGVVAVAWSGRRG
jgi:hypothetical protein